MFFSLSSSFLQTKSFFHSSLFTSIDQLEDSSSSQWNQALSLGHVFESNRTRSLRRYVRIMLNCPDRSMIVCLKRRIFLASLCVAISGGFLALHSADRSFLIGRFESSLRSRFLRLGMWIDESICDKSFRSRRFSDGSLWRGWSIGRRHSSDRHRDESAGGSRRSSASDLAGRVRRRVLRSFALRSLQSMGFTRSENNAFVFDSNTSIEQLNNVLRRLDEQRTPVPIPTSFGKLIPFVSTLKQVKTYEEKKLLQHIREEIFPRQRFVDEKDKDLQLIELLGEWFSSPAVLWKIILAVFVLSVRLWLCLVWKLIVRLKPTYALGGDDQ